MIGVPAADRAELRRLADLLVHREEGVYDVPPQGMEAALALAGYFEDMVTDRRRAPARRPDLGACSTPSSRATGTAHRRRDHRLPLPHGGGRQRDDHQAAGQRLVLGMAVPRQKAKAFADPGRVADWVEETLRFDTSSQMLLRVTRGERRAARHRPPRRRAGPAAGGLGQPGPRRLPRARPLRPRPRHDQAGQLRQRTALLPGCAPGPPGGPGRARGAGRRGSPTTRSTPTGRRAGPLHQRARFRHLPTSVTVR